MQAPSWTSRAAAWSAGALTLCLAVATVALHVSDRSLDIPQDQLTWLRLAYTATLLAAVGTLLAVKVPRNPMGWLALFSGLMLGLSGWGLEYAAWSLAGAGRGAPGSTFALFLSERFTSLVEIAPPLVLALFPDGRLPSRRWRALLAVAVGSGVALCLAACLHPKPLSDGLDAASGGPLPVVPNPLGVSGLGSALDVVVAVVVPLGTLALLPLLALPVVRLRRAEGEARAQLKWFVWGAVLFVAGTLGAQLTGSALAEMAGSTALVAGIAVAVLRHRLYDIDRVINRTVVYVLLSACVVVLYAGIVTALGLLLQARASLTVSLVATGLVAAAFSPLRSRLQGLVDRRMHGDAADPYRALSRLGEQLAAATVADEVLPGLAASIAQALRVPYVAVEAAREDGMTAITSYGSPVADVVRMTLVHRGEPVGELEVGTRERGVPLGPRETALLESLARQAAVAVHAHALTLDLQASRERIVSAREEERRRLRRDLHDGLGPTLAGIAVRADAASRAVELDPEAAAGAMRTVKADAQQAVADVRRLVHDLRPPALDDLGLAGALQAEADRYRGSVDVAVDVGDVAAGRLPAAVEVAVYRVVAEALANVARHSGAAHATVRVARDSGGLVVHVDDDGSGLEPDRPAGVGLASMRERAAELGGTCTVTGRGSGAGTAVRLWLPLHEHVAPSRPPSAVPGPPSAVAGGTPAVPGATPNVPAPTPQVPAPTATPEVLR